jgi:hypothetical protein
LPVSLTTIVLGGSLLAGFPAGGVPTEVIFDPVMRMSACSIGGPPLPSMTRTSCSRIGRECAAFASRGIPAEATSAMIAKTSEGIRISIERARQRARDVSMPGLEGTDSKR